eukprot:GHVU01213778.1.p1 GENE.GHVU01213778.1~~GHVU01213778.1.p1  ORF type:complete len:115 (+),score=2.69 GHVU01213778.1:218-562(+)
MNPAYHHPVGCLVLGASLVFSGLVCMAVFMIKGDFDVKQHSASISVPILCAFGALCMLVGLCTCCSRRERIRDNWEEWTRKQALHTVTLGTEGDPASQAQPIISGYDPRRTPKP